MLKPEQIPDDVVEAAAKHISEADMEDYPNYWKKQLRASIRAALAAWPGMGPIRADQPIGDWCDKLPAIILPLPEKTDE